ncbi:anti-sigma factor [Synechococcus sp. RedBA-s]|uniref:anti-sigma factor n=1 Tax=Synechococcus sp. RedBA-s TaxID=2823741 RepID=UPI0020CEC24E|nr:anti-sigma factor [Synechococcus sp. RedBA-s]MCP9800571.1 anti-sigma factor [Synechococcus sp. RedBA-s]
MNPTNDTPQSDLDALLAGHALGDLDSAECEQLASLLRQDPGLQHRMDEFKTTLELLPLALPIRKAPPQRLRQRLLDRAGTPNQQQSEGRPALGVWLLPAFMGLALLAVGIELHQTQVQLAEIQQQLKPPEGLTPMSRHLSLEAPGPGLRANGEVMVTGNPTHNVLMLNDLPPPPPGYLYRLWANVDGRVVGCVSFKPTDQGHVAMLIPPMPTSLASSVSVSVERDPLGAAPTGAMVLTTSL